MKRLWALALTVALLACLFICSCNDEGESSSSTHSESASEAGNNANACCTVDILKIGKADCIIINTGTQIIMIDTGEAENFKKIKSYMSDKGYDKIDTLILTHPDKDHIGGASKVLLNYSVGEVIESSYSPSDAEYLLYHSTMSEIGLEPTVISDDYIFTADGCEILVDAPSRSKYADKQSNNSSLVVSIECGDKRLLFCGDAMEPRLEELIVAERGEYDFVKLPYHGNYLENYREFLDIVRCQYGVITCSDKNPADERTLDLLKELGVTAYETKNGRISVQVAENQINITQK